MNKKTKMAIICISIAVIIDQLTKWLASTFLGDTPTVIIENFFQLELIFNKGAAFSILIDARWFFVTLTLVVLVIGWRYYMEYIEKSMYFYIGGILFFAGTIGNFIDRLFFGEVTDFLAFIFGNYHFAIFNFADMYLSISIVILLLGTFIYEKKQGALEKANIIDEGEKNEYK